MSSVIINDYVENKRIKLFFLPDDFAMIDERWGDEDPVLQSLQTFDFFLGRSRWRDLEPAHFRLLVAKNLQNAAFLAEEDRLDDDNPVVSSLNFLICAFIRCIENTIDGHVELIRLNRVGDLEVAVEFTAALRMEAATIKPQPPLPPKKDTDPFSIVVDNTKD
jgi:hypothetical protein